MAALDVDALSRWLRTFAASVADQKDQLTALDAAIGDADHGANMHRGMTAVVEALAATPAADPAALLKQTGMVLIRSVGGASGPLYGTLFLRMAPVTGAHRRSSPRRSPRRCGPGSTASSRAARPSSATRRWSTPSPRPWTRSTPPWPPARPSVAALRAASAAADEGRDATTPTDRAEGAGELPR